MIETVTTTLYQTVIWVDGSGKPVSTEINDLPPEATKPSSSAGLLSSERPPVDGVAQNYPHQSYSSAATDSKQLPEVSATLEQPITPQASPSASDGEVGDNAASGGMGICYDMINSQTQCKDKATVNSEFSFLKKQGFAMVRVYDIGCPLGDVVSSASQNSLKLMVGINSIASVNEDVNKLINMVSSNWAPIDTVYIGNEIVNGGHGSAAKVASAVSEARDTLQKAGYSGHVITVDTFNVMQNDPTICSTSDYCAANTHAFFNDHTAAEGAGQFVMNAYNAVVQANGGKRVIVSESGWPWQGSCNGQACPSVENQKTAMNSIMKSFASMPGNLFLFQGYNAGYKPPGQFGVEPYFGIYDSDHYAGGIGPS